MLTTDKDERKRGMLQERECVSESREVFTSRLPGTETQYRAASELTWYVVHYFFIHCPNLIFAFNVVTLMMLVVPVITVQHKGPFTTGLPSAGPGSIQIRSLLVMQS